MTVLLAQLSDPHITVGRGDRAPAGALAAAVRAVRGLEPRPHAVLVSGDLADGASAREYERVRDLLAPLGAAVHVLPGNHDDRDALRAHFPAGSHSARAGEPYRHTAMIGGELRLVVCDSTIPGLPGGLLDRAWLEAQLAVGGDIPTIVAMHHPPLPIGMPALDEIGLPEDDRAALAALLRRHSAVRRVVAGHVHRCVSGVVGGCAVAICPSTYLAARLEVGAEDYALTPEPPAFLVHALLDGELVTHVQPVH